MLSLALGGYAASSLEAAFRNVLTMTHSPMVIHVSAACASYSGAMKLNVSCALPRQTMRLLRSTAQRWNALDGVTPRVLFNHRHLAVWKHSTRILTVHLANFLLCLTPPHACSRFPDAKFVLLGANQIFWRRGLEPHVGRHALSFCAGFHCNNLDARLTHSTTRDEASALVRDGLSKLRWVVNASRLWTYVADIVAGRQLQREAHAAPRSAFALLFSSGFAPGWQAAPINTYPHEGSFYPIALLREFVQSLRGSIFEEAVLRDADPSGAVVAWAKNCSGLMACGCIYSRLSAKIRVGRSPPWNKGSVMCALEESLLPTFIAQRHAASVLQSASPPLALRLTSPSTPKNLFEQGLLDDACALMANDSGLAHVFAWKVPAVSAGQVRTYLRKTLLPIHLQRVAEQQRAKPEGAGVSGT